MWAGAHPVQPAERPLPEGKLRGFITHEFAILPSIGQSGPRINTHPRARGRFGRDANDQRGNARAIPARAGGEATRQQRGWERLWTLALA